MLLSKSLLLSLLMFIATPLLGDQVFEDKNCNELCIAVVQSVDDIDLFAYLENKAAL